MNMIQDVASGADRHLDITFGLQVVESSSIVSVLFRKHLAIPSYISFFHLFFLLYYKYLCYRFLHVRMLFYSQRRIFVAPRIYVERGGGGLNILAMPAMLHFFRMFCVCVPCRRKAKP